MPRGQKKKAFVGRSTGDDAKGNIVDTVYRNEQQVEDMLKILGYKMTIENDEPK